MSVDNVPSSGNLGDGMVENKPQPVAAPHEALTWGGCSVFRAFSGDFTLKTAMCLRPEGAPLLLRARVLLSLSKKQLFPLK